MHFLCTSGTWHRHLDNKNYEGIAIYMYSGQCGGGGKAILVLFFLVSCRSRQFLAVHHRSEKIRGVMCHVLVQGLGASYRSFTSLV